MAPNRPLPEPRNPLLSDENTPPHDTLVERRRLGQTDLGQNQPVGTVGLNSAAVVDNLGVFDYAHLRVPLPKDLKGSGVFPPGKNNYPESYFLMRRSHDGHISATGMFKAAYPWASVQEEADERQHHKTLPTAGREEVAGNVWISPEEALKLADEYDMRRWVIALLDPETIAKGAKDTRREIASPPKYDISELRAPVAKPTAVRRRELRSASPTKQTPRKMATPRKRRTAKQSSVEAEEKPSKSRKASGTHPLENGTAASETPEPGSKTAAASSSDDVVRVTADETIERDNDVEVVHTTVKVEMPAGHPDLPLPEDTEQMVRLAQEMVAQAKTIEGSGSGRTSSKRKANEVTEEEAEAANGVVEADGPSAKRQKVPLIETLKKERVRSRTALSLAATIAIGSAISYFF